MSFLQKLVLYALAVALLPLAGTGFRLIAESERALLARIDAEGNAQARAVASHVEAAVSDVGERATVALSVMSPLELDAPERQGLVRLLLSLSDSIAAAGIFDRNGQASSPLQLRGGGDAASVSERVLRNAPPLPALASRLHEALVGQVYYPSGAEARVAVVVPCAGDAQGVAQAFAVLELSLQAGALRLAAVPLSAGARVTLLDAFGRVIAERASSDDVAANVGQPLRAAPEALTASATLEGLGWTVQVAQDKALAFAPVDEMRQRILLGLFVTTAVVLLSAFFFAVRLRQRVATLVRGARAFGARKLTEHVPIGARDELGELAATMNQMADALLASLEEIAAWNRTLEQKVVERTEELRAAQAQLLMQSKLAAIGQLGAGVAHEVNNPLAGILGYTQLLLNKHPEGDADNKSLKRIEEAAKRCRDVTSGLLRFSQRGLVGRTEVVLNDVVSEVLDLVESGLAEQQIRLVRELSPTVPMLQADAGQLALVLTNLVANAKNAMPKGGELRIVTAPHADGVSLQVQDTGVGIAPEHLQRVFEPFFTTKSVWTGVGLGLSLVYRVVTDHGGRVDVESKVGTGTCVSVRLPLRSARVANELTVAAPVGL